ncbi:LysE family transporter [Ferrovibrio sp. MS7]|uniref:LysE family translocator n=1 Tax=Ferrovibrio plantarum TaxID=3119164 RepID=UPI003135628C
MVGAAASLLLAALIVMGSPGPSTVSLTAVTASLGLRASLNYGAGLVLGTVSVLLLVTTGVSGLLLAWPQAALPLRLAGLAYCLYLAWRIATGPPLQMAHSTDRAPGWLAGYLLALANPKAYLAIGAVYSGQMLLPAAPLADAALKCLLLSLMVVLIHLAWGLFGALLARHLRDARMARLINGVLAAALVLSLILTF